jgi:regulatory protein
MRLLARREHSCLELQHKLEGRGFAAGEVAEVLASLAAERLQSDERFAEAYVYFRSSRGRGPVRIRAELRERGIGDELISRYLSMTGNEWQVRAAAERQKRFGDELPQEWKERSRQARFLQNRGFSSEQIRVVLDGKHDE